MMYDRAFFMRRMVTTIIGKKSNYVIRFLNVGKKRGFPFFPWGRLGKLGHFPGGLGPRMKFIPKV